MQQTCVLLFLLLGVVLLENQQSLLNFSNIVGVEQQIKEKCDQNGGETAFNKLKNSSSLLTEIILKNFDFLTFKNETKASKKLLLRETFQRHCEAKNRYRKYIKKIFITMRNCLSNAEKPLVQLFNNITERINDFVCYKSGARVTMFVDEDGFECFSSKVKEMIPCVSNIIAIEPELSIANEYYLKMSKCVVKLLDECEDVTAANMVHALMKNINVFTLNYTLGTIH